MFPRTFVTARRLGTAVAVALCINGGCSSVPPTVRNAGARMDAVEQGLEEFGSASVSAPVLAPPDETFKFELTNAKPDDLYDQAKTSVQGKVADLEQQVNILALAASAALTPKLSVTTTTQPATAPTDLAKLPTDAAAVLTNPQFIAAQKLFASSATPSLNNRDALITAAGDNATRAIFQTLGDPALGDRFADKRVLFGVATVAVNPGWRTRKGYAADIAVLTGYSYGPARLEVVKNFIADADIDQRLRRRVAADYELPPPDGKAPAYTDVTVPDIYKEPKEDTLNPLVAAVSPLTETQVLDSESSRRQRDEFALNLAFALRYAGLDAQAQAFEQFVHDRERDVATRDNVVAVNTYSDAGGVFGFQVGPKLTAVGSATSDKSARPEERLGRQSFPALVIFGFDRDDLRPRLRFVHDKACGRCRLCVIEPQMTLTTTVSWLPTSNDRFHVAPRLDEGTKLAWAYELRQALDDLPRPTDPQCVGADQQNDALHAKGGSGSLGSSGATTSPSSPLDSRFYDLIRRRAEMLKYKAFGNVSFFPLPVDYIETAPASPANPSIDLVYPTNVTLGRTDDGQVKPSENVPVVFLGQDLDGLDLDPKQVVIEGNADWQRDANGNVMQTPASKGSGAVTLLMRLNDAGPVTLKIPVKDSKPQRFVRSIPISVNVKPAPQPDATVITRTSNDAGAKKVEETRFEHATPEEVISDIKSHRAPASNSADVHVNIDASREKKGE